MSPVLSYRLTPRLGGGVRSVAENRRADWGFLQFVVSVEKGEGFHGRQGEGGLKVRFWGLPFSTALGGVAAFVFSGKVSQRL